MAEQDYRQMGDFVEDNEASSINISVQETPELSSQHPDLFGDTNVAKVDRLSESVELNTSQDLQSAALNPDVTTVPLITLSLSNEYTPKKADETKSESSDVCIEIEDFGISEDECEDSGAESGGAEDDGHNCKETPHMCSVARLLRKPLDPNFKLPDTVTKLIAKDGSTVYVVGTAHFSAESQEDVAKTIQATQPDIVVVELCKSRVSILQLDEATILEEAKNINMQKIRTTIKQSGVVQGIMYLLLLSMSAHITKQLGMAPGGEFRRAFQEAKKVPGCLIQLGDRPIQITLQRALAALSWWQKIRLAWGMITSKDTISKEEVERCKQKDLLEEMLAEMTGEFPALSRVFVAERDTYLAHSLQLASTPFNCSCGSGGGPNASAPVVVGVVGIGHVPGIITKWDHVTDADIPPILFVPGPSLTGRVFKFSLKASLAGLAIYGAYRILPVGTAFGYVSRIWPIKPQRP